MDFLDVFQCLGLIARMWPRGLLGGVTSEHPHTACCSQILSILLSIIDIGWHPELFWPKSASPKESCDNFQTKHKESFYKCTVSPIFTNTFPYSFKGIKGERLINSITLLILYNWAS